MKKVITYGTYDVLHYGHVRLLERAKALGDYLIVGVTTEDFDKARGKINVSQSLMERIEAVKKTGIADEIIVEEYEGQKIDDIKRYNIDVFAVGDDWKGSFDYLRDYCEVVYLPRTQGVSSTEIRAMSNNVRMGVIGKYASARKIITESEYVNGLDVVAAFSPDFSSWPSELSAEIDNALNLESMLESVDSVYIYAKPEDHYDLVLKCLESGKHVLCEAPVSLSEEQYNVLLKIADDRSLVLMDGLKTAYSLAYDRLLLLVKSGKIGKVVSVDSTCTSMVDGIYSGGLNEKWNSICAWGPTAMLPVFQILGTGYQKKQIVSKLIASSPKYDAFTRISFVYENAVASCMIAKGAKSEGSLVISGTKGYIYVPSPWWKTDYFEVRYENQADNKRYFYQLDGEGIRYELCTFLKSIRDGKPISYTPASISAATIKVIEAFYSGEDVVLI